MNKPKYGQSHKPDNHNVSWQVVKAMNRYRHLPKDELNKLLAEAKTDPYAREKAILHNLRLASWYAKTHSRFFVESYGVTPNDCFNLAVEGLIKAVDTYKPASSSFSKYAALLMHRSILNGTVSQFMPIEMAAKCIHFEFTTEFLEAHNGALSGRETERLSKKSKVAAALLRARIDGTEPPENTVPSSESYVFFRSIRNPVPLDSEIRDERTGTLEEERGTEAQDTLVDRIPSAYNTDDSPAMPERNQRDAMIRSWVRELKKPLREAVEIYFFQDDATFESAAAVLGLTRQAVEQRIKKALPALRRKALVYMRGVAYPDIPPSMDFEQLTMGPESKKSVETMLKAMGVPYLEYSLWDVERFDKTILLSLAKKAMAEEGLIHYLSRLLAKKNSRDSSRMLQKEGEDALLDLARRMKEEAESRGKSF
ncbi:MAG: sigma-70 family RNA polymerase sigma factor [Candidatus Bilamarchaeaceae archaeon]